MIDWDYGLEDLLTKQHFWKTLWYGTIMVLFTMFFDLLGPLRGYAGMIYTAYFGGMAIYTLSMWMKIQHDKRAQIINEKDWDSDMLKNLSDYEDMKEELGLATDIKESGREKLRKGEDLSWRDVW